MLNIRVDEWLDDLIGKAAGLAGAASKSEWAREALEAGARRELAAADARRQEILAGARLGGGFVPRSGVCRHPTTARTDTLLAEVCALCGAVTRVKM